MLRLAELIKENGLTQKEFAHQLNLAPTTLNNYVKGQREPDLETIKRFCDYFDCTIDYFLGRSTTPETVVTDEDAALLAAYHAADDRARAVVDLTLEPYKKDGQPEMIQLAARGNRIEKLSGTPDRDEIREALGQVKSESETE